MPQDSDAQTLADLKGKEVAFGDQASTSGTWVPRYQLLEAGLVAGRDYRRLALGAHDAVVQAVARRQVAAGGLSLPIYRRLMEEGRVEARETRILAESEAIPEYMTSGLPNSVASLLVRATAMASWGIQRPSSIQSPQRRPCWLRRNCPGGDWTCSLNCR